MRRSALLCFWQIVSWTARFLHVKTKAYKNAFYHMYVCPTSAHRGFQYGYIRYKSNTFTLKTTLFGWQSMILRSDLTLLNINMSKNSTFAWFFLLKSLYYQWLFVSLQQQNPPRFPFEQRTRAGLLLFMGTLKLYAKQTLSISEQIELLKNRGLNIANSSKAAKFLGEVSYFRSIQYLGSPDKPGGIKHIAL